jgi:hypothetical protein
MEDRRALVGVPVAGADFLRNVRFLFDMRGSTWRSEPIATRGERLALFQVRFSGEAGADAPIVAEHLSILEHDDTERVAAVFAFDPSDVDGAYQTLDARYDAGEAATVPHAQMTRDFRRAFAARDWDALATRLAPDLVVHDHRVLGWETLRGPSRTSTRCAPLVDLAPDVRLRIDHFEMAGHGAIYVPVWCGTHDGGGFETPSVIVAELDDRGRIRRFDQYDLEHVAEARARFAEIDA